MPARSLKDLQHAYAEVNNVRLHYVRAGSGPLVLFLHGFPQFWYAFRHQLREFSSRYTVVAVDLRGVNLSSAPTKRWEHGSWMSAEDMKELIKQWVFSSCVVVGHDWGGAIGYSMALHYPELLDKLIIISASHPGTFDRELHHNQEQIAGGGHWLFLRRADTAEKLRANNYAGLRATFEQHTFFSKEDIDAHVAAWSQPGALEGMLGWYRKEGWGPTEGPTPAHGNYASECPSLIIPTRTLVIYGDADMYLHSGNFEGLDAYIPDLTLVRIDGGSHWLMDEYPERLNALIDSFLNSSSGAAGVAAE
jgi:epoxide hydrolase 4